MLNEVYAVWHSYDQIEFSMLPNSFALKLNSGFGTNVFVPDESTADETLVRGQFKTWIADMRNSNLGHECGYNGIDPRIMAERLYPRNANNEIPDHKFFCFDGKVRCLYVMQNYVDNHAKGELGFFNREFGMLPVRRKDFNAMRAMPQKPVEFEKMVTCAETLSRGFPHVRVDFFDIEGKAMFAEMTFYNASGYTVFDPHEFDYVLGKEFELPVVDSRKTT